MLRTIAATISSLEDLPLQLSMNMRLIYNENTPEEYEPPGFKPCNFEHYKYDQGKCRIRLGDVNCLWHQINMEINCSNKMLKKDEFNENMDSSLTSKKDLSETIELVPINISTTNDLSGTETENHEDIIINKIEELKVNSSTDQQSEKMQNQKVKKIFCICSSDQQDNMTLIECSKCGTNQHAICYNVFASDKNCDEDWKNELTHCCLNCFQNNQNFTVTDKSLIKMDKKKLFGISLWRKAIYEINKFDSDKFHIKELMTILSFSNQNIMKSLIKKLENADILLCDNKKEYFF